jgi:hypothetical protein
MTIFYTYLQIKLRTISLEKKKKGTDFHDATWYDVVETPTKWI